MWHFRSSQDHEKFPSHLHAQLCSRSGFTAASSLPWLRQGSAQPAPAPSLCPLLVEPFPSPLIPVHSRSVEALKAEGAGSSRSLSTGKQRQPCCRESLSLGSACKPANCCPLLTAVPRGTPAAAPRRDCQGEALVLINPRRNSPPSQTLPGGAAVSVRRGRQPEAGGGLVSLCPPGRGAAGLSTSPHPSPGWR